MARIHLVQTHTHAVTVSQDRPPGGCTDVADPIRVPAEHRYQIALALVIGHHDWERV